MAFRKRLLTTLSVGACALAVATASAPLLGNAADHADAPGDLQSPSGRRDADINDVYVFPAAESGRTAFAVTTHPGLGVVTTQRNYASDVAYRLNIDETGDAVADTAYVFLFAPPSATRQTYRVIRRDKEGGTWTSTVLGSARTGTPAMLSNGVRVFAGPRSDPFFFDLDAFKHVVAGDPSRTFCDAATSDFFAPLNTNAIVLEVPNSALAANIGIWARTTIKHGADSIGSDDDIHMIDQMGRPAINTVFNKDQDKNRFNHTAPFRQRSAFGGKFVENVRNVLAAFSSLDTEGAYTADQLDTLAGVLIPDVLTYQVGTPTAGPLNGRALADDVIDVELNLVTGGFPFPDRDGTGAVPSDCVGPHTDYLSTFPYLGVPH